VCVRVCECKFVLVCEEIRDTSEEPCVLFCKTFRSAPAHTLADVCVRELVHACPSKGGAPVFLLFEAAVACLSHTHTHTHAHTHAHTRTHTHTQANVGVRELVRA